SEFLFQVLRNVSDNHRIVALIAQLQYVTDTFFFQAEDGIRDFHVTGVQTCALPISASPPLAPARRQRSRRRGTGPHGRRVRVREIGRASCRERVWMAAVGVALKKNSSTD